jgi:hypothetical protein
MTGKDGSAPTIVNGTEKEIQAQSSLGKIKFTHVARSQASDGGR